MAHPQEPKLEELRSIMTTLLGEPSTDMNLKKIEALKVQIERLEVEEKESE